MSTATRIIPGSAPGANPSNIGSLTGIFNPKSIAVILADDRPTDIGERVVETVLSSAFGGPRACSRCQRQRNPAGPRLRCGVRIASNATAEGRAQNRRIDIALTRDAAQ